MNKHVVWVQKGLRGVCRHAGRRSDVLSETDYQGEVHYTCRRCGPVFPVDDVDGEILRAGDVVRFLFRRAQEELIRLRRWKAIKRQAGVALRVAK